jgi:UDP-N-acetylmuramoylalanine--D-glutamate ligase
LAAETNGKTTSVHWLHHTLQGAGFSSVLAGNVGTPFSEVAQPLATNAVAVIEVSSFQLETIHTFRPRVGAILNITPDHLDRYPNMQAYIEAKARLMCNQKNTDTMVFNAEDKYTPLLIPQTQARVVTFSRLRPAELEGLWVEQGKVMYRLFGLGQGVIMTAEEIALPGPHNVENALAVAAMALALGVEPAAIAQGLKTFAGVAHRLERVRNLGNVLYVNDSKGTNVDAVEKAIASFAGPLIMIMGGRDKNGDFTRLNEALKAKARAVVVIGEAAEKISSQVKSAVQIIRCETLDEAVARAAQMSRPGDVVLFSPGCASFDQYRNYEHRGEHFRTLVRALQEAKV